MAYKVYLSQKAAKQLEAMSKTTRDKIRAKLFELVENPRPSGCKVLEASSEIYRIRIGDYRATYCILDNILMLLVLRVANRREIYNRKEIQWMGKDAKEWIAARKKESET